MATDQSITDDDNHDTFLRDSYSKLRTFLKADKGSGATLPQSDRIQQALAKRAALEECASLRGPRLGDAATVTHLLQDIVPALTGQATSSRYYGFVTGGVLPVAEAADNIVSALDQNVGMHLATQSVAGFVEDAALRGLISLLGLGRAEEWPARVLTTGATASNVLGLAAGRDYVVRRRLLAVGLSDSVAELGLLNACMLAGLKHIQVLTSGAHSSLFKAASIVGLGRAAVKELPYSEREPWRLDVDAVERELQRSDDVASIISVSAGEVNTGRFATTGMADMKRLRRLADEHGAWIHVDGGMWPRQTKHRSYERTFALTYVPVAFGVFARVLPAQDPSSGVPGAYSHLLKVTEGLELADSITADGHKALNVPYDCGIFFSRHLQTQLDAFGNPNAAYLSTASPGGNGGGSGQKTQGSLPETSPTGYPLHNIPSALNLGVENSRRFRALPLYAVLLSLGREGIAEMLQRMVDMARALTRWLREPPQQEVFELLPEESPDDESPAKDVHMIVLLRARDPVVNETLVDRINASREVYVSGTVWKGRKACRVAVSNWRMQIDRDMDVLTKILLEAVRR